jgi:hypothetical protein
MLSRRDGQGRTAMAEKTNPTKLLEQEVIRLRQELSDRGVATAYARLYGPLAVVSEGHAAMAIAVLTGLLGVAHAIQLRSRR